MRTGPYLLRVGRELVGLARSRRWGLALVWVGGVARDAMKSVSTENPRVLEEGYVKWKVSYRGAGAVGFGGLKVCCGV